MKFIYAIVENFQFAKAVVVEANSDDEAKAKVIHEAARDFDGIEDANIVLSMTRSYGVDWIIQEIDETYVIK